MSAYANVPNHLPVWVAGFPFGGSEVAEARPTRDGWTRLGALDLLCPAGGAAVAPLPTRAGGAVLFDGYLFDRDDLRRDLGLPPEARDVDLVAAAYERWGEEFLARLPGSYLVAVFDPHTQALLLGHDPLGRHPVFYAVDRSGIWFASNVLALADSGAIARTPNRMSLAMSAFALWPEAGETFFAGIRRLRAGHCLDVRRADGSVREVKYWDPLPTGEDEWLSEAEVLTGFEPALERAVARCMQLDPGGLMLSGGVDSVVVAALASQHRRRHGGAPLTAVSGRSDTGGSSEEGMQERAASALGMPHVVRRTSEWTGGADAILSSLEVTSMLPGPSRIYWVGTYMAFYRMTASLGLHTVLTGSGGDNWLAVADVHAADLIRSVRLVQLWRFVQAAARTGGASYGSALRRLVWRGGLFPLIDSAAAKWLPERKARYHRTRAEAIVPRWLCPDPAFRAEFIDRLMAQRTPALDGQGRLPRNYYQHSLAAAANPHLYYEFETAFHVEKLCGVRLLSPYHDRDLVRFFTRIPPPLLVRGNKYKGLLRPVVEKHLPGLGFGSQRKDYPQEDVDAELNDLRASLGRALPGQAFTRLQALGIVDGAVLAAESDRVGALPMVPLVRLYAALSAERWVQARTA